MITEIVEFEVKPGTAEKFIAGVEASRPLFERSPGFISLELHLTVENSLVFVLLIQWETVAHHMEMFRNSPEYGLWRGNIGEFMAGPPRLQHTETKLRY
ncbi:antibiotic biosynthesis monooxygenase [Niveispirillum sp.]|uniref:antibiotic biosynthesis monooxygenase family protein n=1 Tax=Niveispirillum sp. TaxID=1917217 RepID=UPI001B70A607|nr:antibiotic biosynthesis monooxygenase family protein [Niveispirillum sp.]MBP7335988.1 antibiotic biosynthesis monooxygenase [Niveispirillum sp.]